LKEPRKERFFPNAIRMPGGEKSKGHIRIPIEDVERLYAVEKDPQNQIILDRLADREASINADKPKYALLRSMLDLS
jgi:hypothetical protein